MNFTWRLAKCSNENALIYWPSYITVACKFVISISNARGWKPYEDKMWRCSQHNAKEWFVKGNMVQLANDLGNHPWNLFWFNLLDLIGFFLSKFLKCLASSKFITLRIKNYYRITNGCKYQWSQPLRRHLSNQGFQVNADCKSILEYFKWMNCLKDNNLETSGWNLRILSSNFSHGQTFGGEKGGKG